MLPLACLGDFSPLSWKPAARASVFVFIGCPDNWGQKVKVTSIGWHGRVQGPPWRLWEGGAGGQLRSWPRQPQVHLYQVWAL